jgi:protein TonB
VSSDLLQAGGLPPVNDRMLTTCFLAAVFHGIVILGVTFSASDREAAGPNAPALEVLLVNDQAPRAAHNATARYVAQRTQKGAGNASDRTQTVIPESSPAAADQWGIPGGEGLRTSQSGVDQGEEQLLAAHAAVVKILYFADPIAAQTASPMRELLEKKPDLGLIPNDDGIELRMRGEARNQLWVAADTRESDVAVYLDRWRRKIERVGTMNFPTAARRRKLSGTPVIEVTIGSDGKLLETVLRRSSGHGEIDRAALRILQLAAPYDPFPRDLTAKHDQIRIAYEWQFLGGAAQGPGMLYAEPNAPGAAP